MKKTRAGKTGKANVSNWTRENIAWLSGLFEGEGCISLRDYASDGGPRFNVIIKMTDKDVLDRAHNVSGMGTVAGPFTEKGGTKPSWRWSVYGNEKCVALAYAMYPYLHERRRAKISDMLAIWVRLGRERGAQEDLPIAA